MTKSMIFKAAHKLAKTFTGDYSARLSMALKLVWSEIKNPKVEVVAMTKTQAKNKEDARKELTFRMEKLNGRSRLLDCWKVELEKIKTVLAKFDSIPAEKFNEVPGNGLACELVEVLL